MSIGYIYIIRNPSHEPDVYKIGKTSRTIEDSIKRKIKKSEIMKLFIYFLLSVEFILLVFMPEISFARYANEGREYDGAGGSGFGPLSYLAFYGAILYALYSLFTGSILS